MAIQQNMDNNDNSNVTDLSGRVIVVLGAPCSGKGTQCKKLADQHGLVHISTGDLFREHVDRGTDLGAQAKEYLDRRCFVPDELVVNLVRDKLRECAAPSADFPCGRGALLDGFPRTASQAESLLRLVQIDRVVFLEANDKALVQRAPGRRISRTTGAIYHMQFVPPSSTVHPAHADSELIQREGDDDPRAFKLRLDVFRSQVRRVLPFFSGRVHRVNALQAPDEVQQAMIRALEAPAVQGPISGASNIVATGGGVECAICFSAPADFLCVPCGHQCGCEECLATVQRTSGLCPICRTPVTSLQQVFACGKTENVPAVGGGGYPAPALVVNAGVTGEEIGHPDLQDKLDKNVASADNEWPDDMSDTEEEAREAQHAQVSLVVAPCKDIPSTAVASNVANIAVQIHVPEELALAADEVVGTDVCCVVDVSGSMGTQAVESDGVVNKDGLTILDIVKHALKTVMHALSPQDRLSLVGFSTAAHTVFPLENMTEDGCTRALAALETMHPDASTNIWAGLLAGMDNLRECKEATSAMVPHPVAVVNRRKTLLLLTDGQPNAIPPRGHLAELRQYKDKHPDFNFQLNTFGFGYSLDSELLLNLAAECGGTFAFIPDAVIVGTTFVDTVANALSTFTQNATLSLCPMGGAEFGGDVLGFTVAMNTDADTQNQNTLSAAVTEESWGRAVSLGPLQLGQMREIVVPMKNFPENSATPYLEAIISYSDIAPSKKTASVVAGKSVSVSSGACTARLATLDAAVGGLRSEVVTAGWQAIRDASNRKGKVACETMAALVQRVGAETEILTEKFSSLSASNDTCGRSASTAASSDAASTSKGGTDGRLVALKADLEGRMSKALQGQDRFNRWGKHYLRALARSHQLEQCTNFMDAGLQLYGGEKFREHRAAGDKIFLSLPPPRKSAKAACTSSNRSRSPPQTNMTTYYAGCGGGCFGAQSTVERVIDNDGTIEKTCLNEIRASDYVRVADGSAARVRCVVRIARAAEKNLVVFPGGLQITPRHPVFLQQGGWQLPIDLAGDASTDVKAVPQTSDHFVYNLVLESGKHTVVVDGIACATWGHGLTGPVIEHDFFGNHYVLDALSALPGWHSGFVALRKGGLTIDQGAAAAEARDLTDDVVKSTDRCMTQAILAC
eukprot:TRINITY_DN75519_c0_g1_i1.p1 TRINITY_DN75519_c0_g1~~TRINITY_DN75519_c0_g1_i1.p1  ORF type:complete len:1140 (-),score=192.16 TRINITY_DN75519_c0_g1_i1:483-3902(-)